MSAPSSAPVERTRAVEQFEELAGEARACAICAGMAARTAVLSRLNGCLTPRVLFVAEAPGRQGGDRTGIPMCGDASGMAFEALLASIGLTREDVFITNAVLCNPRSPTGANRPPTAAELRACNPFLRRTLTLLDAPVVATLGAKALAALERIAPHGLRVAADAARAVPWHGRVLIPLYHPSPQVLISRRSLAEQMQDWQAVRQALEVC